MPGKLYSCFFLVEILVIYFTVKKNLLVFFDSVGQESDSNYFAADTQYITSYALISHLLISFLCVN